MGWDRKPFCLGIMLESLNQLEYSWKRAQLKNKHIYISIFIAFNQNRMMFENLNLIQLKFQNF